MMQQHRRIRIVPQFPGEAIVSRIVERFAKDHGLDWQAYHHDEPIWYISEKQRHDSVTTIRTVQVAAFYGDLDLPDAEFYSLWAIPFAQEIDEAKMLGWTLEQLPEPPSPIPGAKINKDNLRELSDLLYKAWSIAKDMTSEDIRKGVSTPLPAKPDLWPSD